MTLLGKGREGGQIAPLHIKGTQKPHKNRAKTLLSYLRTSILVRYIEAPLAKKAGQKWNSRDNE